MDPAETADGDAVNRPHRSHRHRAAAAPVAADTPAGGGLWAGALRTEPPIRAVLARGFLYGTAVTCVSVALLVIGALGLARWPAVVAAVFMLLAVLTVAATRLPPRALHLALALLLPAIVAAMVAAGLWLGWGLKVPGLAIVGLLICMLCVAAGWQAGAGLAAVSAALLGAVAAGWVPAFAAGQAPQPQPMLLQLGALVVAMATGLAVGVTLSRLLSQARRATDCREQRFRALLALAVDGYWEIDAAYRLTAAADQTGTQRPLTAAEGLGRVPWQLEPWHSEADALSRLLAHLDGRQPFRDIAFCWTRRSGQVRHYRASGEPRFNRAGSFTGYWGVLRDITPEQDAQSALAATETRYRELFSRIPTPLVLHRRAVVIDANAAAVALFGQRDLADLVGTDLLTFYEDGDSRGRARQRLDLLHGQPAGTALPLTHFRLLLPDRQVVVRATSVCVNADGGPANLAIYVDDTERLAAEEAVRRSETLLSHLVATSPDLITLSDTTTGRYAMVNRAFERFCGWTAAEAIGRTSIELGIWRSATDRRALVDRVRRDGAVSDWPVDFVNRAGGIFSMRVSAARFVMDQRDYLVITARDVTEKERERLEREAILLNASIGIVLTRQGRFVLVNRHFEEMFGCAPAELNGQPTAALPGALLDGVGPGTPAEAAMARGEAVELEAAAQRKDGSAFTARIRGRLVDPQQPLHGGVIWIVEDTTERRQFEQALARARDEAESANRAKSAFLANTSHELRTPLNALIGLSRLARDEAQAPPQRRRYLEQIEQSAQSLAAIISDILDLSRIEAGKLPIEMAPFDLVAELQALQRSSAVLAEGRPLSLRIQLDAGVLGEVLGDALRVRQIVNNYLVNAIKFTPEGRVWLRAGRPAGAGSEWVRIEVEDTGPGIPADTLARLFKPFTQADVSTTRRFGGTGLGLSICHELATLMGGRVGADSHEGRGSLFWVELPLPPRSPAAAAARGLPAGPLDGGRSLADLRVLVAEDNAVNMMIAVALLERWGVAVTQAEDGREAVAAVQRAAAAGRPFDAVLMDVQMPVMGGHEAARALRQLETAGAAQNPLAAAAAQPGCRPAPLPIIALTAAALFGERDEALAAGMDDFLTKPIDADQLQATLYRWCPRRP